MAHDERNLSSDDVATQLESEVGAKFSPTDEEELPFSEWESRTERLAEIFPRHAERVVRRAERLARKLQTAKKERELERLYRSMKILERDFEMQGKPDNSPLPAKVKAGLYFLLPHAKQIKHKQVKLDAIHDDLQEGITLIKHVEDFKYLLRYFEAIVAYRERQTKQPTPA